MSNRVIVAITILLPLLTFFNQVNSLNPIKGAANILQAISGKERCFDQIGCFKSSDYQMIKGFPSVFLPKSPQEMELVFELYTPENRYDSIRLGYNFTVDQLPSNMVNTTTELTLIVHGYKSEYDETDWMGHLKDLLIRNRRVGYSVVAVSWPAGSNVINYFQAVANTRVVGAAVAFFMKRMNQLVGIKVTDMNIIGHSLGAHVAGFAGKEMNPKIKRITALDPAGPSFHGQDSATRLASTDAYFVEALHTNQADNVVHGFGIKDALGDVDYYPNGGHNMPDCGYSKALFEITKNGIIGGISNTLTCDHSFAYKLIRMDPEKLNENCQFVGYECDSWNKFKNGECHDCGDNNTRCSVLSIWGDTDSRSGQIAQQQMMDLVDEKRVKKKRFFKTLPTLPFCLHHYTVIVDFAENSQPTTGTIKLSMDASRHNIKNIKLTNWFNYLKSGNRKTYLITGESSFGKIRGAIVTFDLAGISMFNPIRWFKRPKIKIKSIQVKYMSNINPQIREKESTILCPQNVHFDNEILLSPCNTA